MTTYVYEKETTSSIPPMRLFKAFLDGKNLLPQVPPEGIKGFEILEGDGGPGTLYQINLGEGNPLKSMKQRVDAIDKENIVYKYSILTEGESFLELLESISIAIKMKPGPDGGSVTKSSTTYRIKVEVPQDKMDEVAQKATKNAENSDALYKSSEAYLLSNPDEYN